MQFTAHCFRQNAIHITFLKSPVVITEHVDNPKLLQNRKMFSISYKTFFANFSITTFKHVLVSSELCVLS